MAQLSQHKRETFSQRMTDILNYGALNLAMAIGYQTGLFEAMASFSTPQPSAAIAARAGLQERYVREWLGIMFTAKVVELLRGDDELEHYVLPPEHAAFLTRSGGDGDLAVYTQEIPLLTNCAMEQVLQAFQSGAGIPPSCYPPFQAFMAELANAKHHQVLLEKFLPSVEGGQLLARLKNGIKVCDLGCGEGVAMLLMAEAFPQSRFTGIDIDNHALEVARNGAASLGLMNTVFLLRDAAEIKGDAQWGEAFDYVIALDAIHDQKAPQEALLSVHHMLSPDGIFSMVDIAAHTSHYDNRNHPLGPFLYTVSLMHCLPVGLVDGGAGLGMMWGQEQAVTMLQQAGFARVQVQEMPEDPFNLHFCCRK